MTEIAMAISQDETNLIGIGCGDQFEFEFGLDLIDGLERARARDAG